MIINRNDLLNIIKQKCQGMKYFIGLHGVNNISSSSSISDDEILKRIEDEGLISNRTLTGTITFFGRGDIMSNDSKNKIEFDNYNYCNTNYYAILVFPSYIKTSDDREIYLGNTNLDSKYSKYFDSTGHELTSLADLFYNNQIIDRKFVFGTFKKLDNENIDLHLNPDFIKNNETDFDLYKVFNSPIARRIVEQNELDKILHLDLTQEEKQKLKKIEMSLVNELETTDNQYLIKEVLVPILETIAQLQLENNFEEKKEIQYVTYRLQLLKDNYYKVFDMVMKDINFFKYGLKQLNNISDEKLRQEFLTYFLYSSDPIIFGDTELIKIALKNKINIVDRIPTKILDDNLIHKKFTYEEFNDEINRKKV